MDCASSAFSAHSIGLVLSIFSHLLMLSGVSSSSVSPAVRRPAALLLEGLSALAVLIVLPVFHVCLPLTAPLLASMSVLLLRAMAGWILHLARRSLPHISPIIILNSRALIAAPFETPILFGTVLPYALCIYVLVLRLGSLSLCD